MAKDWRAGTFGVNFSNRSVPDATATEISKIIVNPSNMVGGRFEVCASSLSDYGNRRQKLAAQSQILPIFYVNIEHIDSKMGEIWVVQADFEPI